MGQQPATTSPSFAWKAIWNSLLADGYKMVFGWLHQQQATRVVERGSTLLEVVVFCGKIAETAVSADFSTSFWLFLAIRKRPTTSNNRQQQVPTAAFGCYFFIAAGWRMPKTTDTGAKKPLSPALLLQSFSNCTWAVGKAIQKPTTSKVPTAAIICTRIPAFSRTKRQAVKTEI
ncbi:hypothetical protein [Botryobacter ruber]|uniref:hypothetical protein n=1 Tax=Botryobacter ruber TaxID=2171629 RepID=UPI000F648381|nr:hypothetical protein [Botryobacter ruber]